MTSTADPVWLQRARRVLIARGQIPTPRAIETEAAQRAARYERDQQRGAEADAAAGEYGELAAALADGGVSWPDLGGALYLHPRLRASVIRRLIVAGWLVESGSPARLSPGPTALPLFETRSQ